MQLTPLNMITFGRPYMITIVMKLNKLTLWVADCNNAKKSFIKICQVNHVNH